jgi:hypothetical protein
MGPSPVYPAGCGRGWWRARAWGEGRRKVVEVEVEVGRRGGRRRRKP